MRLPAVEGVIRRRLLLNYRVDPDVIRRQLPSGFQPKTHAGHAIAGICLIRLESIRPRGLPEGLGFSSENAAHRIAVTWESETGPREGVFIPRRDTSSWLNRLAGGRVFPGEHHAADFEVTDDGTNVALRMTARDGSCSLEVAASAAGALPPTSCFATLGEASAFFEPGSLGYSATSDPRTLHGVVLRTRSWRVQPLAVRSIRSTIFEDGALFPPGSVVFDHGLVMRDLEHEWSSAPDRRVTERQG